MNKHGNCYQYESDDIKTRVNIILMLCKVRKWTIFKQWNYLKSAKYVMIVQWLSLFWWKIPKSRKTADQNQITYSRIHMHEVFMPCCNFLKHWHNFEALFCLIEVVFHKKYQYFIALYHFNGLIKRKLLSKHYLNIFIK